MLTIASFHLSCQSILKQEERINVCSVIEDVRSEGITVVLFKPRGLSHVSFQSILKQKKNAHVYRDENE